jgi:hypothetical protein
MIYQGFKNIWMGAFGVIIFEAVHNFFLFDLRLWFALSVKFLCCDYGNHNSFYSTIS